jgi:putative DNA-invertase from lambdoid prophage Rac
MHLVTSGGEANARRRQAAALYFYCRASTANQTCARQERDLRAFARKGCYKGRRVWKETASWAKQERAELM